MLVHEEVVILAPKEINVTGEWLFLHDADFPCGEALRLAVRELGQVRPCLVVQEGGKHHLVVGLQEFLCLREVGQEVRAKIIEADGVERGLLVLNEALGRPLSHGRQVAALRYFSALAEEVVIEEKVRPLLGHPPASPVWARLKKWLSLPATWDEYLKAERLPLEAVDILARLTEDDLEALKPFFGNISWSKNNAVNFLTWLWETSVREGKDVEALLEDSGMIRVLESELSPKDATAKLMERTRRLRYPTLTDMEEHFARTAKEMTAGTSWTIQPSKNFESKAVTLTVRVKDEGDLERIRKELQDLSQEKGWGVFFCKGRKKLKRE